ncbi:MAG TPA: glycoside hydrolase family 71/99-like protein [Verrucomicrobiae bacterium]|nr:glycoside hydrolase family 71/99-like protein [Verrucomicrobiae bacterium]
MKPLSSDAWYRVRFTGRDWGETNAYYNLQLSEPDGKILTTSATNLVNFTGSDFQRAGQLARHFVLANTAAGNSSLDVDEVRIAAIKPYKGPVVKDVNTTTLLGKVMCGYQGWFGVPGDGSSEPGWRHWTKFRGPLEDGNANVDLWPDVSELDADQRFPTGFRLADGKPAEVFSSFEKPTVLKHFEWMQEYGLDGVFVQRFANGLRNQTSLEHCNTVLANCREGANLHGRTYAVMYDLSGLPAGHIDDVINDWRALRSEMLITEDPAYLNHRGKPVVAIWGIGFNDHRDYTLAECRRLIEFLKTDPEAGGCTVMLGVPAHWRELKGDAVSDPLLLDVVAMADIISPWTVGRYADPAGAARYAQNNLEPDLAWCREHDIDYLPVVFPGFSWHNLKGGPLNQIPRLRGQFLWSQFYQAKRANASMVYVAMFDELDEGTAIFKCANDVPIGEKSEFLGLEGLPSDYYLKMVGAGTKLIRGERALEDETGASGKLMSDIEHSKP